MTANTSLRNAAKTAGVPLWAIAERIGISEATMSRNLRHELSESDRALFMAALEELKEARKNA